MVFKLELTIEEATAAFEAGIMDQLDKVIAAHHKKKSKPKAKEAAQEEPEVEEVQEEVQEEVETKQEPVISMEQVRERVVASVANKEKAKEIMTSMGVKKLTSLDTSQLKELYDALGA